MEPVQNKSAAVAYKWLSVCIIIVAAYYWIFTLGLVFNGKKVEKVSPRQTFVYRTFVRQNWRLFAFAKLYNRKMLFVVREKLHPQNADTTDLVQFVLNRKRKYAPFNNFSDAMDRILYEEMNNLTTLLIRQKKKLKDSLPGRPAEFYQQLATWKLENDSLRRQNINNIVAFGKFMMQQEKKDTLGKEYQLMIIRTPIPLIDPKHKELVNKVDKTVFISSYKSF